MACSELFLCELVVILFIVYSLSTSAVIILHKLLLNYLVDDEEMTASPSTTKPLDHLLLPLTPVKGVRFFFSKQDLPSQFMPVTQLVSQVTCTISSLVIPLV